MKRITKDYVSGVLEKTGQIVPLRDYRRNASFKIRVGNSDVAKIKLIKQITGWLNKRLKIEFKEYPGEKDSTLFYINSKKNLKKILEFIKDNCQLKRPYWDEVYKWACSKRKNAKKEA